MDSKWLPCLRMVTAGLREKTERLASLGENHGVTSEGPNLATVFEDTRRIREIPCEWKLLHGFG